MGLAEKQTLLARLYTDGPFRETFFADPLKTGRALGLTANEARELAGVSADEVRFFADSLRNKRLQEVRAALPQTSRILGESFAQLFQQHAASYLPRGIHKHRDDAIAFAAFIEKSLQDDDEAEAWIVDVLRYESSRLKAVDTHRRLTFCRLRYDIRRMARDTASGDVDSKPEQRRVLALWFRFSSGSRLRHIMFP